MEMIKFRPNIVVDVTDDDDEHLSAWEEDFWSELEVAGSHRLALTANCARCTSINIDYESGRRAAGEKGTVLKKLMKDRRVDPGSKWSPIFGRYAFLPRPTLEAKITVGDDVKVTKRIAERDVWSWPKV